MGEQRQKRGNRDDEQHYVDKFDLAETALIANTFREKKKNHSIQTSFKSMTVIYCKRQII